MDINIEMTELERQHSCLETIINMLISRNWLSDNFENHFKKIIGNGNILDSTSIDSENKKIAVKFYNLKLTTLKNDREIDNFVSKYPDYHKILIVIDVIPKIEKQIMDTKNFELFRFMEIIKDISKHHLVPRHILLSKDDAQKVMDEYKIKKKDMGRIFIDDVMSRYLYAQKDDIIQIIRYSIVSGYSTYYRLVVLGSIYN